MKDFCKDFNTALLKDFKNTLLFMRLLLLLLPEDMYVLPMVAPRGEGMKDLLLDCICERLLPTGAEETGMYVCMENWLGTHYL
jgi:hypothetical protein